MYHIIYKVLIQEINVIIESQIEIKDYNKYEEGVYIRYAAANLTGLAEQAAQEAEPAEQIKDNFNIKVFLSLLEINTSSLAYPLYIYHNISFNNIFLLAQSYNILF
jgi:hypothetical protein